MRYLDTLRALVAEKEGELARLEAELTAGRAYLSVLQSQIEAAEARTANERETAEDPVIVIRRLILEAGKPLYIDDILRGLDLPLTRETRDEIRQLLLSWVRRGEIFSRPRPAVFGLIELESD